MSDDDFDKLLTRDAVAKAINDAGYTITSSTLATMAARGGGPEFERFGRTPLYRLGPSLNWAKGRMSKPILYSRKLQDA